MTAPLGARETWDADDATRTAQAVALHQQQQIDRGEIDRIAERARRKAEDALADRPWPAADASRPGAAAA